MSKKTDNGGPAFPSEQGSTEDGTWNQTYEPGMSVRDWFAGHALTGILEGGVADRSPEKVAADAYSFADAMLEYLKRGPEND